MGELTREEVLHVAHLARIDVTEEDINKYKIEFDTVLSIKIDKKVNNNDIEIPDEIKQILDEINRINELDVDGDILISPTDNKNVYREDIGINEDVDVLRNAPKKSGNYIEIKRFVND